MARHPHPRNAFATDLPAPRRLVLRLAKVTERLARSRCRRRPRFDARKARQATTLAPAPAREHDVQSRVASSATRSPVREADPRRAVARTRARSARPKRSGRPARRLDPLMPRIDQARASRNRRRFERGSRATHHQLFEGASRRVRIAGGELKSGPSRRAQPPLSKASVRRGIEQVCAACGPVSRRTQIDDDAPADAVLPPNPNSATSSDGGELSVGATAQR